jgi:hypothetical protein
VPDLIEAPKIGLGLMPQNLEDPELTRRFLDQVNLALGTIGEASDPEAVTHRRQEFRWKHRLFELLKTGHSARPSILRVLGYERGKR